jgi:hypothetical protein
VKYENWQTIKSIQNEDIKALLAQDLWKKDDKKKKKEETKQ